MWPHYLAKGLSFCFTHRVHRANNFLYLTQSLFMGRKPKCSGHSCWENDNFRAICAGENQKN